MKRLGELAPLLREATVDDCRLLERLVTFLPLAPALQRLRLQVLSVLAVEGALSTNLLRSSLLAIFEERDEDSCDPYQVLHWAFELPGLPVDVLRMTIRREIAYEMASIPDDLEELTEPGLIEGPAYRIFQDLLDRLDQRDYPAAHSMDTTWFAVDGKGQVACFETFDMGVVPATWLYMPASLVVGPEIRAETLFVDSERQALLIESIPASSYRQVHEERICLGCFTLHKQPHRTGIVCYEYDEAERYTRENKPIEPLLTSQMPQSYVDFLGLIRFEDVDFSTASVLDIPNSVLCVAYGDSFWELDRATDIVRRRLLDQKHTLYNEYLQRYRDFYPRLSAWAASQGFAIEPPPDYPAAHSADTTWFAVDRDGHVGRFVTLENGTIPAAAGDLNVEMVRETADAIGHGDLHPTPDDWDLDSSNDLVLAELHSQGANSDVIYNLRSCLTGEHSWNGFFTVDGEPIDVFRKRHLGPAVGIVKSLELVHDSLNSGLASLADQTPSAPPYVVLFDNLPRALGRKLISSEQCFSLKSVPDRESLVRCGAFDYIYDGWFGPYVCQLIPRSPLHVDQLPMQLRELISRLRFDDLSFAETSFLQPVEHVPCPGGRGSRRVRKDLVKARIAAESRSVTTIQPEPDDLDDEDALDHPAWTRKLLEQIEDFRETQPTRFSPDLVRVSLEFDSPQAALDVLRAAHTEAEAEDFVVRGRAIVFLDQGITDPSSAYERRFSPDDTYTWLGEQIEKGRFAAPRISLSRPLLQPSLEESQNLCEEHADVCDSFDKMFGNRSLIEIEADEILDAGPEAVRLGIIISVLSDFRRRRQEPDELEHPVDGREPLVFVGARDDVYCPIIARLIPKLTATSLEDFALVRRMTAHVQLVDVFRLLELRMLSLLSGDDLLSQGEIEEVLLSLLHERDVDLPLDEMLPLLELACADTHLPGHVLQQSVEVALVRADHVYPHCNERRNPQVAQRCRNVLSKLDRVS